MTEQQCQEVINKASNIDAILAVYHPDLHKDFRELWAMVNKYMSGERAATMLKEKFN